MALIVQKFGGTSVGSAERIEAVAEKIISFRDRGDDVVVVVSAMSGETNRLTALAQEMMEQPTAREMDVLLSTGEQVTIALLSMALEKGDTGRDPLPVVRCAFSPTMLTPELGSARLTARGFWRNWSSRMLWW